MSVEEHSEAWETDPFTEWLLSVVGWKLPLSVQQQEFVVSVIGVYIIVSMALLLLLLLVGCGAACDDVLSLLRGECCLCWARFRGTKKGTFVLIDDHTDVQAAALAAAELADGTVRHTALTARAMRDEEEPPDPSIDFMSLEEHEARMKAKRSDGSDGYEEAWDGGGGQGSIGGAGDGASPVHSHASLTVLGGRTLPQPPPTGVPGVTTGIGSIGGTGGALSPSIENRFAGGPPAIVPAPAPGNRDFFHESSRQAQGGSGLAQLQMDAIEEGGPSLNAPRGSRGLAPNQRLQLAPPATPEGTGGKSGSGAFTCRAGGATPGRPQLSERASTARPNLVVPGGPPPTPHDQRVGWQNRDSLAWYGV